MDDKQAMHAMSIDDAYHVERTLARGPSGVTELVSIDGNGPFVRKKIPSPLAQRNVWAALSACQSNRLPRVEATYELPDRFVIVYDYVPGSTLAQIAEENGRLAPNVAVQLIDQICEAVQELHQHGVIHRDITPANVIVAQDGAHLIDFGIARIRSEASNRSRDTTALGTYGFASPEQYGFAKTDARSDVFSLGRLLGFMLTGVYPDASDYEQRLADDAAVPARLRAVIGYACAFEPSKRPQSVQEFSPGAVLPVQSAHTERIIGKSAINENNERQRVGVSTIPASALEQTRHRAVVHCRSGTDNRRHCGRHCVGRPTWHYRVGNITRFLDTIQQPINR